MKNNYPKSIVVDIDDTLSFTLNRDWKNAIPNQPLIDKLNKLYDDGWDVFIVTARGNLSCSSREEAEEKYRPGIEKWMADHGVKYTAISFQKILASYYIDDKGITPEDFVAMNIEELKGGMSGAFIEKRNDKVYKTADNTQDAVAWYRIASKYFNTPKIESVIGNTMCMEFIEHSGEPNVFDAIDILNKMKNIPTVPAPFSTYRSRIDDHLKVNTMFTKDEKDLIHSTMRHWDNIFEKEVSFSHGDFSIDNMLNHDGKIYLIDPIYVDELYSSWLLDAGKLLHSLKRYGKTEEYEVVFRSLGSLNVLKVAELSQWVRIWKYSPDDLKERTVEEVRKLLKEVWSGQHR